MKRIKQESPDAVFTAAEINEAAEIQMRLKQWDAATGIPTHDQWDRIFPDANTARDTLRGEIQPRPTINWPKFSGGRLS